ncbi:hypothetical protein WNY37_08745 [Henriciella sp. AS95]|uniref:hypothetical protein n=1 Tax=Henriciella sp. AS95 TaxID=3135782 RepID=UPI003173308A
MTEFGTNGAIVGTRDERNDDYRADRDGRIRIRRVALACFLCGIAASITVALVAAVIAFTFGSVMSIAGMQTSQFGSGNGFMAGAFIAIMIAGFNWYLFYIVVPITWIVLFFSIGLFPRRGIRKHGPYYRWGAIWGGLLVGGTTGLVGGGMPGPATLGAFLSGGLIGAIAGLICAALFLAIVRPKQQLPDIATDVF